jgi:pimeloyl-ACP methyl ester carboxylesterase
MRLLLRCVVAVCVCLLAVIPAWAQNSGGLPSKEHTLAKAAYERAERVVLLEDAAQGDVVHYQFDVPVGSGPFDVIRIHRVVREVSPGRAAKKMEGILLLPGRPQFFEPIFMQEAAASVPLDQGSVALYLAAHGVDVWGMDYGHSFIPYPTTDFLFLKGWGIDKEIAHIHIALSVARFLRVNSEQGNGPIHILGFSYGGFLVYAAAAEDSQNPGNLRNIKGIVTVDGTAFKQPMGSPAQLNACNSAKSARAALDAGTYHSDSSSTLKMGLAALNYPDDLSPLSGAAIPAPPAPPVFPAFPASTFTNFQAVSVQMIRTKFLAGSYTVSPPSATLLFTDGQRIVNLFGASPAYMPYQLTYDLSASQCSSDAFPVVFDDYVGEIEVPIFYIARQEANFYSTTVTGSRDVSKLVVNPTLDPSLYGHADFFLANNAASEIWQPILDWIRAHR